MSRKAIFCLVKSQQHAEKMIHRVRNRGFLNRDVSALYSVEVPQPEVPESVIPTNFGRPVVNEMTWLYQTSRESLPGYVAAGPLVRALAQAGGAASTRIGRGLVALGVPETAAKSFERKIKGGSVLISFHNEHNEEMTRAQTILQTAGGEDFCVTDASMPTDELSLMAEASGVQA
jgi:hypothetical protein